MALLFTTPVPASTGIIVQNAYGRVSALDSYQGVSIQAQVEIFASEEAFTNGYRPMETLDINPFIQFPYDRTVDGTDILGLAHTALKASLEQQGWMTTISL